MRWDENAVGRLSGDKGIRDYLLSPVAYLFHRFFLRETADRKSMLNDDADAEKRLCDCRTCLFQEASFEIASFSVRFTTKTFFCFEKTICFVQKNLSAHNST